MTEKTAVSPCPVCRKIFTYDALRACKRCHLHLRRIGFCHNTSSAYCSDVNLLRRHARHCTSVASPVIAATAPQTARSVPGAQATPAELCQKASRSLHHLSYVLPDEVLHMPLVAPCQPAPVGTPAASLAKANGRSAVMGEVCWFCLETVGSADSRTSAEYGYAAVSGFMKASSFERRVCVETSRL